MIMSCLPQVPVLEWLIRKILDFCFMPAWKFDMLIMRYLGPGRIRIINPYCILGGTLYAGLGDAKKTN
jgi:hypothetical protein